MINSVRHATVVLCAIAVATPGQAKPVPSAIFRFAGGHNGLGPRAGLIMDSNGILYGTTSALESPKNKVFGTVFSLTPPSGKSSQWTQSILWRFRGGTDGANPASTLVMDSSGNLYGTTLYGNPGGTGTVFELSPPTGNSSAWSETIIHNFGGSGDGTAPTAGLVQAISGTMYGVTNDGGANGRGTVYQLVPPVNGKGAWTESVLYSFVGTTDGQYPIGGLFLGTDGSLYGTTQYGGINGSSCGGGGITGCGVVFSLTPPADGQTKWTESVIYYFTGGSDGSGPLGNVISDGSGNLLGTTNEGGSCSNLPVCGVVFKLSPPTGGGSTWSEVTLYSFQGKPDGQNPSAGLLQSGSGTLYGTTANGGTFSRGTVFSLSPPANGSTTWSEVTLHSFGSASDGQYPLGNLVQDANGYLYGTTYKGGRPNSFGTVFRVGP